MNAKGFTLIELMITVAIIGIISAIAYPSYSTYMNKTRRAEVTAILQENVQVMERYYSANGNYGVVANDAYDGATLVGQSPASGTAVYTIAIDTADTNATTFKIVAAAVSGGPMANDTCAALSINELGVTTGDDAVCWRR